MPLCADLWGDLKDSRFFQVWLLFWLIFGVIILIALIQLGALEHQNDKEPHYKTWRIWDQYVPDGLSWPDISFLIPGNGTTHCKLGNKDLLVTITQQSPNTLFTIHASNYTANSISNTLECTINTPTSLTAKWSVWDPHYPLEAPNYFYLQTMLFSQVSLKQSLYEDPSGAILKLNWNPTVISSPLNPSPVLILTISDFTVSHYREYDWYTNWQFFGDIGGIIFMTYLIHSLVMLLFGPCLPKDSVTFGGQRAIYNEIHSNLNE
eukprot:TRINITY_DN28106_c0_g1_i1.p1 TRINITY_DN28106_c0_g1~~TRINITY_DN28106_c0_g1_i1.p1  ORF type:complete len:264 (+),score=66.70 TRINITY_DN28106_c0_g1_i1:3-794(+)